MPGYLRKDFVHAFHAGYVGRVSGEAFDLDDFALPPSLSASHLSGGHRPGFLVDAHVVHAGHVQFLIDRDDDDALGNRFFKGRIQAVHIAGVDQDGVHFFGHQVLQLLDLAGHVCIGAFDHQFSGDVLQPCIPG